MHLLLSPHFRKILKPLRFGASVFGVALLIAVSGCRSDEGRSALNEEEEPGFKRARQLLREGRKEEALQDFLRLIQHRAEAPESHMEAAQLYLHDFKQPLKAYYHFDRFLELKPHSSNANLVRGQLQAARREFIRTLPGNTMSGQLDRIELAGQVESLVAENDTLKRQLQVVQAELEHARRAPPPVAAQPQPLVQESSWTTPRNNSTPSAAPVSRETGSTANAQAPVDRPETVQPAPTARGRLYEVERGDTLSNISRKVYGHPRGWEKIYQANRDQLPNQNSLRPGQLLKIPPE